MSRNSGQRNAKPWHGETDQAARGAQVDHREQGCPERRRRSPPPHRRRCRGRGNGPQPKMRQGDSGISAAAPTQVTIAGTAMLPVPRMTLASELNSHSRIAAGKDDVGIGQRGGERCAAAAHRAIEPPPAGSIASVKASPNTDGDGERVQRQRVGVAAASGPRAHAQLRRICRRPWRPPTSSASASRPETPARRRPARRSRACRRNRSR